MNNSNFAVINYIFFGDSSANNDVVVCKFNFIFFIVLMNNSNFSVINYIYIGDSSANNDVVVCKLSVKFAFNFFIVLVNNSNYVVINDIDIYFGDGVVMLFNNSSSNNDVR